MLLVEQDHPLSSTKQWAYAVGRWMESMKVWPCLTSVQVQRLRLVPSQTLPLIEGNRQLAIQEYERRRQELQRKRQEQQQQSATAMMVDTTENGTIEEGQTVEVADLEETKNSDDQEQEMILSELIPKPLSTNQVSSILEPIFRNDVTNHQDIPSPSSRLVVTIYIPAKLPLALEEDQETSWQVGSNQFVTLITKQPTEPSDQDIDHNEDGYYDILEQALRGVSHWIASDILGYYHPSQDKDNNDKNNDNEHDDINDDDDDDGGITISDGSFPDWYLEQWYWDLLHDLYPQAVTSIQRTHFILVHATDASSTIVHLYLDSLHRLETVAKTYLDLQEQWLEEENSSSSSMLGMLETMKLSLDQIIQDMETIQQQLPLRTIFPIQHYLAIFAPLLFPLLLPFIMSWIRERKRYRDKINKKERPTANQS